MKIRAFRRQKGISQQDFAKELGVTQAAVSQWERELTNPNVELLTKIADLLNVTVDELLRGR